MSKKAGTALSVMAMVFMGALASPLTVLAADAEETYQPALYATIWALLPPLVAIVLALITKEVYSSLFVGIVVGALIYSGFKFEGTVTQIFEGGIIKVLSDSYNVGILIFLVILGSVVCMMNKAGGSAAFGRWASKKIHTRVGAELAAIILGILIFIDDYFNCLTVGSVMRPVTDRHHVSRAKFAYLIDATAAPVCIIAPISSWAAAVSGFVKGQDGLAIFVRTIPYNFYAILTIVMMVGMVLMKTEFGAMRTHEINALNGDLYTTSARPYENATDDETPNPRGKVIDLVIPIVVLVICCVISMIYTGGFFSGTDFVTAFSQSDASTGLAMGSAFGLVFAIIFYMIRRVVNFRDCMGCIPEGFKAMVPAIMILTFAWTLKAMTDSLGAAVFVEEAMRSVAGGIEVILPAIIFLVGCGLAFATGTSWGTFGILIPIVVAWGTLALIIATYTPVFDWISYPMGLYLKLLGVPEAFAAAPATLVGFTDMFIPALLSVGLTSVKTKFIIGVLSLVQIIYLTEVGTIIIKSEIPLNFWKLLVIFLERTIVALPLIVLFANLVL